MRKVQLGEFSFICPCCGDQHVGLPDIGYASPIFWSEADAAAKPAENRLNSDFCVIDGEHFFIRCVLDVPIRDADAVLGWGVWVTQSKSNYELYGATFDETPERQTFGYLANRLPKYPDTVNIPTQVHWRGGGRRPLVEPEASDHPLYRDWSEGITRERAIQFALLALHPES
jgi:hypothetical protein